MSNVMQYSVFALCQCSMNMTSSSKKKDFSLPYIFPTIQYRILHVTVFLSHNRKYFFFPLRFNPIPGHGLPLRGFAITLIGHATLRRTPLDE
jgi:hypothetical protein